MKYLRSFNESVVEDFTNQREIFLNIEEICYELQDDRYNVELFMVDKSPFVRISKIVQSEGVENPGSFIMGHKSIKNKKLDLNFYYPIVTEIVGRLEQYMSSQGYSMQISTNSGKGSLPKGYFTIIELSF